jgi:hypothetical protein
MPAIVGGYIEFERPGGGRPVDPSWGVGEGRPDHGFNPDYPSQGLPGRPEYPSQGPVRPPYPGRPGQGLPYPGRPVDPGYGHPEGGAPGQGLPDYPAHLPSPQPPLHPSLPIYPVPPGGGEAGQLPVLPGTIWPPLPPGTFPPGDGLVLCVVWIQGLGSRYAWIDPDATIPVPPGGLPGHPDQGLPGLPPHPGQGLPGQPPRPDQGLPPAQGRPDQGLPPTAQPKR